MNRKQARRRQNVDVIDEFLAAQLNDLVRQRQDAEYNAELRRLRDAAVETLSLLYWLGKPHMWRPPRMQHPPRAKSHTPRTARKK